MIRRVSPVALFTVMFASLAISASAWSAEPDGMAFFEAKIRPVLVEHCYECHSAKSKSPKGGLLVDTKEGLLIGGDSGPSLTPGKLDESPLLDALKYETFKMPPSRKLPKQVIDDFEQWVKMGAPDPRAGKSVAKAKIDVEAGRKFWAYQLPQPQKLPAVKNQGWPIDDLDHFILAKLEANQLSPAKDADRRTLIARLYYDLIGIPPSAEQIETFVSDSAPDAYERLVDKLLASSHFGERWGRHWLDVVRYGESITLRGFVLKDAWRYRDYVIESFNRDVPFDRFLIEQIAGDLLPHESLEDHRRQVVATAFLALGNTNLEEQDKKQLVMDIVDEQLDVIGKGILAQTITCARCHDHKFDPITAKDYYAMAGILKSTKTVEHSNVSKWLEMPLPMEPELEKKFKAQSDELASLQTRVKLMKAAMANKAATSDKDQDKGPMVLAVADIKGVVVDDEKATKVGEWRSSQSTKRYIGNGYLHDDNKGKGEKTLTFIPTLPNDGMYEVRLAYSTSAGRAKQVPVTIMSAEGEQVVNIDMSEEPPINDRWVSLGSYRFERVGQSFVIVSNEGTKGHVTADAVQFLPVAKEPDNVASATTGKNDVKPDAKADPRAEEVKQLEARMKEMTAELAKRPTWLGVAEDKAIGDTQIHVRGNVHNLGETVPRGFMQVAHYGKAPTISEKQSGRLELAQWLASRENPLTARVMVNRVWFWLFGEGLVRTTDNFGTTGELPSHPELLDHLTVQFVNNGWSMKQLIRTLVLSHTYRQSSTPTKPVANDPENRLYSHFNRRRLDAESLRDKLLWLSDSLELSPGGPGTVEAYPAADYNYEHKTVRRSVYAPAFRNSMVELLEVFDAADPSMVVGRRNQSTVAPQALYLMNHPFVIEHAERTAKRLLNEQHADDQARIGSAYQLLFGRDPTAREAEIAAKFVTVPTDAKPAARVRAWSQLVQMLICTVDFRYVD